MFKRYPAAKYRPLVITLGVTLGILGLLVVISHLAGWLPDKRVLTGLLGVALMAVFLPLVLMGVLYREVVYLRTNYADYETSPYSFAWGMATNLLSGIVGCCFLVQAITGWDTLGWFLHPLQWLRTQSG